MRRFFLFICLGLCYQALTARLFTFSWHRSFTGSVGKYMIAMHLHKLGNEYGISPAKGFQTY